MALRSGSPDGLTDGRFPPSVNRRNTLGKLALTGYQVEFFARLKRREKCEHFAVGGNRPRQAVKRSRVLTNFASVYVRIRRKFENSLDDFVRNTCVRFHHWTWPLLTN